MPDLYLSSLAFWDFLTTSWTVCLGFDDRRVLIDQMVVAQNTCTEGDVQESPVAEGFVVPDPFQVSPERF